MFRLWGKIFKDNHMMKDMTVEDGTRDTRTHKIFHAVEKICLAWDLGQPIWLETNIRDFQRHKKTRFTQDSFVEQVSFDYLEIQIIEE